MASLRVIKLTVYAMTVVLVVLLGLLAWGLMHPPAGKYSPRPPEPTMRSSCNENKTPWAIGSLNGTITASHPAGDFLVVTVRPTDNTAPVLYVIDPQNGQITGTIGRE